MVKTVLSWLFWIYLNLLFYSVAYFGVTFSISDEIWKAKKQTDTLKKQYMTLLNRAENIKAYSEQYALIKTDLARLTAQLPDSLNKQEFTSTVDRICRLHNVTINKFEYKESRLIEFYAEHVYFINFEGRYNNVIDVIYALGTGEHRLVTLHDFYLEPTNDNNIRVTALLKTYHYLTIEEIKENHNKRKDR